MLFINTIFNEQSIYLSIGIHMNVHTYLHIHTYEVDISVAINWQKGESYPYEYFVDTLVWHYAATSTFQNIWCINL